VFAPVSYAIAAAVLFYVALPVVGAFIVRGQWRKFRTRLRQADGLPELPPGTASEGMPVKAFGAVDAIGGDDELWIRTDRVTFAVDMKGVPVYLVSDASDGRSESGEEDSVERLAWSGLPAVSQGVRAFAAGRASVEAGKLVLGPLGKEPPLVILHSGDDGDVVVRAIRGGRHRNEYWNQLTQVSLAMGVLSMSGIVSLALAGGSIPLVTALVLAAAFSPLLPLLPPGLAAFMLYRRFWKRARYFRARRDVAALRDPPDAMAVGWRYRALVSTAASLASFAAGLAVNAWLVVVILRRIL